MAYELPDFLTGSKIDADIPRFGYRKAIITSEGVVIMYDGATKTMGQHFIYSGGAIGALVERGVDIETIIAYHGQRGDKCTRIDLAIDIRDSEDILPELLRATDKQQFTGSARTANIVKSVTDDGVTIYFGSRQSEKFVRIYNKAAERGVEGLWTRIEAELKGDRAKGIMRALFSHPVSEWPLIAVGVIETTVKFKTKAWVEAMGTERIEIANPQPTEKDTEGWLMTQVVSAIAKFEKRYPEKRILERMTDAVYDMLGV